MQQLTIDIFHKSESSFRIWLINRGDWLKTDKLATRTHGILIISSKQMNVIQDSAGFSKSHSILSWFKHNFINIELKFLTKKAPTDTGICQILQNLSDIYEHILNILPQGLGFFVIFFSIWKF